jgi:hypothetical protein
MAPSRHFESASHGAAARRKKPASCSGCHACVSMLGSRKEHGYASAAMAPRKARGSTRPKRACRGDLSPFANSRETGRDCPRTARRSPPRTRMHGEDVRLQHCWLFARSAVRRCLSLSGIRPLDLLCCYWRKAENLPRTPAAGVLGPPTRKSRSCGAETCRTARPKVRRKRMKASGRCSCIFGRA